MVAFERRFTMLMVCAVWVHMTHDIIWLCLGTPIAAGIWAIVSLRQEAKEQAANT